MQRPLNFKVESVGFVQAAPEDTRKFRLLLSLIPRLSNSDILGW